MNKVQNKVIVVTGASKGIGAEIAKAMANDGAKVVVNYSSDKKNGEAIVENIVKNGGTAVAIQADVTKASDVKRLFEEVGKKFGQIDTLINNAGVYKFEPVEIITEEEFHRQFNSNVLGTILSIQEALGYFNQNGGSIINISSVASVKATPMSLIYSASKSAVDAITRTLSKELGTRNIRVNSILPGPTQTEGNQIIGSQMEDFIVGQTPLGRIGQPKDISNLAVFLASDDASWITGQKICVSGGFD
ncbi:SDR family NAD(P)-dependent oxidoreductase [Belliella marina]|uniref:SDR family NAD(P)-dependent oxidoreductase n=1 Tax=Belliella marina TaxID=1644146 RepID=A0ABW4VIK8_9BACT